LTTRSLGRWKATNFKIGLSPWQWSWLHLLWPGGNLFEATKQEGSHSGDAAHPDQPAPTRGVVAMPQLRPLLTLWLVASEELQQGCSDFNGKFTLKLISISRIGFVWAHLFRNDYFFTVCTRSILNLL